MSNVEFTVIEIVKSGESPSGGENYGIREWPPSHLIVITHCSRDCQQEFVLDKKQDIHIVWGQQDGSAGEASESK